MKLNIYTLFDSAASAFATPFFMQQDGLALRAFEDMVNADDHNNVANHPDQFTLFKLAEYDDKTGKVEPLDTPKSIALAIELVKVQKYTEAQIQPMRDEIKALHNQVQNLIQQIPVGDE